MNNNRLLQSPMEEKSPSREAGYDQRKSLGENDIKQHNCVEENGYMSLSNPTNIEIIKHDVHNTMLSSKAKVCNGPEIVDKSNGANFLGKMLSGKQLPNDIMVSSNIAEGISNLMINGINHEDDNTLTPISNVSIKHRVTNGVSPSMPTGSSLPSDTSSSSSQVYTYVSQDPTSHISSSQDVGNKSCIEKPKSCMDSKEPNLVMCCDLTNNVTDFENSKGANLYSFEDNNISGHKQISQDEGKEEISKSISNRISAKDIILRKDQSKSDSTVTDSDIGMSCNTLSESSKGAYISQSDVTYIVYESELNMPDIIRLIQKDLSEPYSIYTYRYFIHNWPHLCFMAKVGEECVGAIVCKLDYHKKVVKRGYIAMLAVDSKYRKLKIGSTLVRKAIETMIAEEADEVVLETEITNQPALRLYENLGFVRDKRLFRYYLNGVDALRLKLWLR